MMAGDRIRSVLSVFDVTRDADTVVLETSMLIEAPNWTRDGAALVVNGEGRLLRVPLASPALLPVDTGFAAKMNNDHGLSPDGRMLAVSDHTELGQSCIYVLPSQGGTPRRVTREVPSYWHGWSPDGRELAYAARREGAFHIWTIPVEGGEERRVTSGPGHHDGPDYTPDGRWIWFNSDQGGSMGLWRVHPDGTGRERMTDGASVDWFPHPSPDGALVVYLAYPPGTEGHPRDLDVELRLIPAQGGASRTLLRLFGGQGTINVPSWAPDSRRFAFVRYLPPGN
jgi:Tol biopolymer transport system component